MNIVTMEAEGQQNKRQHFILVHGACHGAWSWYKVAHVLESLGHRVTVPDLAASGIDSRRIEEVGTFSEYSQPLLNIMSSLPPNEKVILVGHSFGGISIALAADRFPDKVEKLVFVAAFMPDCTSSPIDGLKNLTNDPSYDWVDTKFNPVEMLNGDRLTAILFGPNFFASRCYQLCTKEDIMLASTLVRTGLLYIEELSETPAFSKENYGSIPRYYIKCPEDLAITEDIQEKMIRNFKVTETLKIEDADHMVMMSKPRELSQRLCYIANER